MTQTPLSRSKVKVTRPLSLANYWYVVVCSAALGALGPTEGGEGRGHIVAAARLQVVYFVIG